MKIMNTRKPLGFVLFLLFLGTWKGSFGQSLKSYQQIALDNNPTIRAAMAKYKVAQQKVQKAGGWSDPMLNIGAFTQDVKTGESVDMVTVSLMQNIPWFGSIEAKEKVAQLMGEAEFQTWQNEKKKMLLSVSQQYYKLFLNQKQIEIQQANLQILETYKNIALAKVRSGEGLASDVLRVDILKDEARTQLEILKFNKDNLKVVFNILLQRKKNTAVVLPDSLNVPPTYRSWEEDSLFAAHPKVQLWESKRKSAEASQVLAQKSGMPMLGIGVEYMREPMGMDMQMEVLMPMVSISIPIFRGKYKAAQKEAEWTEDSYLYQREAAKDALEEVYEKAKLTLRQGAAKIELKKAQIAKTKQVLKLMIMSYQNGKIEFENILQMQEKLLDYQLTLIQAKTAYFIGLAQMEYLLAE